MNRFVLRIPIILASALCLANDSQTPDASTLRAQLAMQIVTCNSSEFALSWKQYQEITAVHEVVAYRTDLTSLARNIKDHKEMLKSDKLANKAARIRAGIYGIGAGILTIGTIILVSGAILEDLQQGLFPLPENFSEAGLFALVILLMKESYSCLHDDINYARHANTQDLTADIDALATIITQLNSEESAPIIPAE